MKRQLTSKYLNEAQPRSRPIGIFDSGIGGLTVAREIMRILPYENMIYFGDTARVPYGSKSRKTITRFSSNIVEFLIHRDVKLICVACNTASSNALPILKRKYPNMEFVGVIEPGVMAAVKKTHGRIGVIGTRATINSRAYGKLIKRINPSIKVYERACPLFVPLAEEGFFDSPATHLIAQEYLSPLKRVNVDTLILGCTHYPLLISVIQRTMGTTVTIVDSARSTAEYIKSLLDKKGLLEEKNSPEHSFYFSDISRNLKRISERFLKTKVEPQWLDFEQ